LSKDPYYNEAGYEKLRGTQGGVENCRIYNEMVILNLVSSMKATMKCKHPVFGREIRNHFQKHGQR
jgi:ubiquitin-conjugating enzyme E2 O